MIKHIVIWRLHEEQREERARAIKEQLESLVGQIPGLLRVEVGFDFSREEQSGDLVLYSEMESRDALKIYQNHPAHQAVLPLVRDATCERRVVDFDA